MEIRVYYEDTDVGGVVYYANYLKFIERARSQPFFDLGKSPMSHEGHFVVKRVEADYFAPARLGDLLTVRSFLVSLKGASFSLLQQVFKGEEKLFEARVTLAYLAGGNRPGKIPEPVRALVEEGFPRG